MFLILISIYLYTWFFTNFEPIQNLIDRFFLYIDLKYKPKKYIKIIIDAIYTILGCHKCLSLWITFILTLNPLYAILLSYIAHKLK